MATTSARSTGLLAAANCAFLLLVGCANRSTSTPAAPAAPARSAAATMPVRERLSNLDLQTTSLPDPAVVEVYDITDGEQIEQPGAAGGIFEFPDVPPPPPPPSAADLARGFPLHPYGSVILVKRYRTLRGPDARAFADLWRKVEFVDNGGMMCHHPAYAFRCLDADGRVTFETSVCWGCGNFFLRRGNGRHGWYGFASGSPGAKALLEHCKRITADAQSHALGDAGAPPLLIGQPTPFMPDALDAFVTKRGETNDADLLSLHDYAQMRSLSVFSPDVTDAGLAVLRTLRGLRSLTLRTPGVTAAGLADIAKLDRLENFELVETFASDAVMAQLAGLTHLRSLSISRDGSAEPSPARGVTDAGLAHLRRLTDLRYVGLSGTAVTDAGLAALAHLRELRSLDLSQSVITGTGLGALRDLPAFEDLSLARAAVTDDGLAGIAQLPALELLNLQGNDRLTDAGLAHLARAAKVYRLNIEDTAIGDEGLRPLVAMPSLSHLHLSGTHLTDAAVPVLAAMPKLNVVWVGGTGMTDEGMDRLRAMRPKLEVRR